MNGPSCNSAGRVSKRGASACRRTAAYSFAVLLAVVASVAEEVPDQAPDPPDSDRRQHSYSIRIRPLLERYCYRCHAGERTEAEIDLALFKTLAEIRGAQDTWLRVREMIDSDQMPPEDEPQPTDDERDDLRRWVGEHLAFEARANAGDPGPVILRRLNNSEYTYTLRDLTGVESLDPAGEFPVDGAAGEGFTNAAAALPMSPTLVEKFLGAAKQVAEHAVLVPDGIRFSPSRTRSDWTSEWLQKIRAFYLVNVDGRRNPSPDSQPDELAIPLGRYLSAILAARDQLTNRPSSIGDVATAADLNPIYARALYRVLDDSADHAPSQLLDALRMKFQDAGPGDLPGLVAEVEAWQQALWKFSSIGHIGRAGGPKAWMEPVRPLVDRQQFEISLPESAAGEDIIVTLTATDAGDGHRDDFVLWERPQVTLQDGSELSLRDFRPVSASLVAVHQHAVSNTAASLKAVAQAMDGPDPVDIDSLARAHGVEPLILATWLEFLGIGSTIGQLDYLTEKNASVGGYASVQGWHNGAEVGLFSNASDEPHHIPGLIGPGGVAVHPSPTREAVAAWLSPVAASVRITASVQDAHPECGNGVDWSIELRRGATRRQLAAGVATGTAAVKPVAVGPLDVRQGDLLALRIGPRDGSHVCDLTAIDFTVATEGDEGQRWNLAADVANELLEANPHRDRYGNDQVWHFYSEASSSVAVVPGIPSGSLLEKWQTASSSKRRAALARDLQRLLLDRDRVPGEGPDAELRRQLRAVDGPLHAAARRVLSSSVGFNPPSDAPSWTAGDAKAAGAPTDWGLPPEIFGVHPQIPGDTPSPEPPPAVDPASLCVAAPSSIRFRLPADWVGGGKLNLAGTLHPVTGQAGSVQLAVTAEVASTEADEERTAPLEEPAASIASLVPGLTPAAPILATPGSETYARIESACHEFRELFPRSVCYIRLVPVDEVVTLILFHREDAHFQRLFLTNEQARELDRLWDELAFVSREPLELVTAYEHSVAFATQDRPDLVVAFQQLEQPILDRAEAFREQLRASEPAHIEAMIAFTDRAWRRTPTLGEQQSLRELYESLRASQIDHDPAIRMMIARVLTSPDFLYRPERPATGSPRIEITTTELATRLSYFLWSSLPDQQLRHAAIETNLHAPEPLLAQATRLRRHDRVRRLAVSFACQWLHIHDVHNNEDKNELLYPEFAELRGAMREEAVQFFADLFRNDRSILEILDARYAFLNEPLARHYGIDDVTGTHWRRVDDVRRHTRGGILAMASILAKQSGASRTSPILRGAWISETLLGERLPRPPANVPQLPDEVPSGLSARQLTERHTSVPGCAKCHARIDPYGFALEQYDAIGRIRPAAAQTRTTLVSGEAIEGIDGLRNYLLNTRRDDFVRQFCRKLLGFALGRGLQLSDEPLLDTMMSRLAENDYRFSAAVETIVLSDQFRKVRGSMPPPREDREP